MPKDLDTIVGEVIDILKDMTSDWELDGFDGEITAESTLVADLSFESIEIVQLMVALEQHFELKNLASEKLLVEDGRYVPDQKVGDIARFLEGELSAS